MYLKKEKIAQEIAHVIAPSYEIENESSMQRSI